MDAFCFTDGVDCKAQLGHLDKTTCGHQDKTTCGEESYGVW